MNNLRINSSRFSIRFCNIADTYGFKTIGKFEKFLYNLKSPSVKLQLGTSYVRAAKLIKELEKFKKS